MRVIFVGLASVLALMVISPAEAGPEEDALEAIAACRAIKAESVRLVCMDAASQLLEDARGETIVAPIPATPAPIAPAAPAIDTAAAERAALVAEREALEAERAALESERAAIQAAAAPAPNAGLDQPSLLERLRPASTESTPVQIVKIIRRRRTGKLRFVTDEGLVFDQALETISFRAPSRLPAEATISFGALGSKWIRFAEEPGRKYKVSFQY